MRYCAEGKKITKIELEFGETNIEEIVIPEGYREIGDYALNGYTFYNVKRIYMFDDVEVIGKNAFNSFAKLEEIVLSSKLRSIGDGAFQNCKNLKKINLPQSLKQIGSEAFFACNSLEKIVIPSGVTYVGRRAFAGGNDDITVVRYGSDRGWAEKWDYIGRGYTKGFFAQKEILYYANVIDRSEDYKCYVHGKELFNGDKLEAAQAYPFLKRAAEAEITSAYDLLAFCYRDGTGVSKNLELAAFWMNKHIDVLGEFCPSSFKHCLANIYCEMDTDQGYCYAIELYKYLISLEGYAPSASLYANLAYCYSHKSGKDDAAALYYYEKAADAGDKYSCFTVGKMYEEGRGVAPCAEKALYWYEKLIESLTEEDEAVERLYWSAIILYLKQKTAYGEKRAFELLLRLAHSGDTYAAYSVGKRYVEGIGTEASYEKAEPWLLKAAKAKEKDACEMLVAVYSDTDSPIYNIEKAISWLEVMVNDGNSVAMHLLQKLHAQGKGVVKNEEEAKENYALYQSYKYGLKGYQADWVEAEKYLQKAFEAGLPDAQYEVALKYFKRGEYDKAETLWKEAADHGHAKSRTQLDQLCHIRRKQEMHDNAETRLAKPISAQSVNSLVNAEEDEESAISKSKAMDHLCVQEDKAEIAAAPVESQSVSQDEEIVSEEIVPEESSASVRTVEEVRQERYEHAFCMYYGIDGVGFDREKAVSEFKELADEGHAEACVWIGSCYSAGTCVEKDDAQAFRYFSIAAEKGCSKAVYHLNRCYYSGTGVEVDKSKAERLLKEAADMEVPDAIAAFARKYSMGQDGYNKDAYEARRWLERLRPMAESGDVISQYMIGNGYGILVRIASDTEKSKCCEQAFYWLKKAADRGYPAALFELANIYNYGKYNVSVDLVKAKECFEKASERGDVISCERLADIYYFGWGCEKDMKKAATLYCKGRTVHAKCMSAMFYFEGTGGLPKDTQKAIALFKEVAANQWAPVNDKKIANYYLAKVR